VEAGKCVARAGRLPSLLAAILSGRELKVSFDIFFELALAAQPFRTTLSLPL